MLHSLKIITAYWQQENQCQYNSQQHETDGEQREFYENLKSTHKKSMQYTVRGASNLKGFNLSAILDPKIWKTRISGPYGPLKILAPAESLLASLTNMFSSLTKVFASLTRKFP